MAQWWERSPPTNVARVQIPVSTPYVGWVCCWFSPWLRVVFLRVLQFFPSPQKPTFPNSNSTRNQVDEEPFCVCTTSKSLFNSFIFFYDTITELAQNNVPKTSIFERFWSYLALNCKGCLKSDLWLWNGFGKCLLFVLSANGWMIKTWPLRFPAKENPNMEKALFDWPIVLQHDVKAMYRLISRKFSDMK